MMLAVAALLLAVTVHCHPHCHYCEVKYVRDCGDIYERGSRHSGVYTIYLPPTNKPAEVYCDMDTDGRRWTVIQRRMDGTLNFYRPWAQYKAGFGDAHGEYWLGLDNMHVITKKRKYELRVDMEDFEGKKAYAIYSSFSVGPEADNYKLHVRYKHGTAGDALKADYHDGQAFSTFDKDNDKRGSGNNAAISYTGPFWHQGWYPKANLNGVYLWGKVHSCLGVFWKPWRRCYSLKAVAMKIRRVT